MPLDSLMDRISEQMKQHMQTLVRAVEDVQHALDTDDDIEEDLEKLVERSAAGVISAVGALRALDESLGDDEDEDED